MFKLLLADDEAFVRNGILHRIDWQSLGIDEVRQAEDGILALEQLDSFVPDILLTDVKMPRMNGIDLSYEVLKRFPDCKIVFMSGYTDVIYLKSAIELNAVRYIEKPIQLPELERTLRGTVEKCLREKREKQTHALLEETVKMSVPLLKSELASTLISSCPDAAYIMQLNQTLSLPLQEDQRYLVMTVEFSSVEDQELSDAANRLPGILRNCREPCWKEAIFCQRGDRQLVLLLLGCREEPDLSALWKEMASFGIPDSFCAGVGRMVCRREDIFTSYLDSQRAVQSAFYMGYGRLLSAPAPCADVFSFPSAAKIIAALFEARDSACIQSGIERFQAGVAAIQARPDLPPAETKKWFYRLILSLCERCNESFPDVFQPFEDHAWLYQFVASCHTLAGLSEYFLTKVRSCLERCGDGAQENGIVGEVMRYIERNYASQSLSIASICENVFVSSSHVCFLFKKQTGYTLNQYITEYRIKMAKNMLAQRSCKIVNVAGAVGFSDANYFTKAFKKATGLTPSAYREELPL